MLDTSVLQSKTARTLIEILKEAGTITRNQTEKEREINKKIAMAVKDHRIANKKVRKMRPQSHTLMPSTFEGRYKVNL